MYSTFMTWMHWRKESPDAFQEGHQIFIHVAIKERVTQNLNSSEIPTSSFDLKLLGFLLVYPPNKEFFSKRDFALFVLVSVCNFKSFFYIRKIFFFNVEFYLMRWYFCLAHWLLRFTSIQINKTQIVALQKDFFLHLIYLFWISCISF